MRITHFVVCFSVEGLVHPTYPLKCPGRVVSAREGVKKRRKRKREGEEAQTSALVGLRQSADAPSTNPDLLVLDSVLRLTNS